MQALAKYADDSDSSPPPAGPSVTPSPLSVVVSGSASERRVSSTRSQAVAPATADADAVTAALATFLLPSIELSTLTAISSSPVTDRAENSRLPSEEVDEFEGMTEDEIFRLATRPPGDESEWGIPPEIDPSTSDPRLQAKVAQFLRLKRDGQHINTSLMQSSSFANPHIYSKLVEFVAIDERATAFPGGGWLTRRRLEDEIPTYGPKALLAQQNAMAEAAKRAQEGKRREIAFTSSSRSGRDRERDERRGERDRGKRREEKGGLHRPRHGWEASGRRERDRR